MRSWFSASHIAHTVAAALFVTVAIAVPFGVSLRTAQAQAGAVLKLSPATGTFYVGSTFDVSIVVDTGPQAINAVAAELRFPPDILQITNPAVGSSIVSLWSAPPTFSNEEGVIRLQGGIPSPGVKTSQGVVTTLTFRAQRPGPASLVFTGNSQVLANDGRGTNILSLTIGATYRIELPPPQGPAVSSPTHPDQNAWYRSKTPAMQWITEEGVTDFAWAIDQEPGGTVNVAEPKGLAQSASFENLEDGLWYFHIRAKKGPNWGGVTTFLIRIDTTPPADFSLEFAPRNVTSERRPFVNFATTDALSGINRYEVRIVPTGAAGAAQAQTATPFFISAQPPYRFPELAAGGYDVIVRAYDNAGNAKEAIDHLELIAGTVAVVPQGIQVGPWLISWWAFFMFTLGFTGAGYWLFRRQHSRHKRIRGKLEEDLALVRERLRRDFEDVSGRLAEEQHLKDRLSDQLKRLDGDTPAARGNAVVGLVVAVGIIAAIGTGTVVASPSSESAREGLLAPREVPVLAQAASDSLAQYAPIITTYRGKIASDEFLYIGGTAPPDSIVVISIAQERQEPLVAETRADRDGRWSYLHDRFLQPGIYRAFARTQTETDIFSDWGPQVTIEVFSRTISFGGVVLPYQTIFGITNLLLVFIASGLAATALVFNKRSHALKRRLAKEVREAESALQEGFVMLRRDLEREMQLVGFADFPSRKVSHQEKESREKLVADLVAIEERVRKEIEDIELIL